MTTDDNEMTWEMTMAWKSKTRKKYLVAPLEKMKQILNKVLDTSRY